MHGDDEHSGLPRATSRGLDEAIDATARGLTEGAPSAALRAGVAQRIAQRERSSWWLLWPAGAAAVVALVAVLLWPGRTERVEVASPVASDVPVGQTLQRSRGPGTPGESNKVRPTRVTSEPSTSVATQPIVVESIDVMPLDLDAIEMPPMLTVETIAIEPLAVE